MSPTMTFWHTITINRPIDVVGANDVLPPPLTDIDDLMAIELRPSANEKGTEIAVLVQQPQQEANLVESTRSVQEALQEAKLLLECA